MSEPQATPPAPTMPAAPSRWKRNRLLRRAVTVMLPLILIAIGVLLIVGQTSWFWRGVVLPRGLGPNYAESLRLGDIRAGFFPPTIELTDVSLADALAVAKDGPPVLTARRVKVALGYSTRPGRIVIRSLETEGLSIAVRKDARDRNSLTESIEAMGRGKKVSESTATSGGLPTIIIEDALLDGIAFKFDHEGVEGGLVVAYHSTGPIALSNAEEPPKTFGELIASVGDISERLRVQTIGQLTVRGMGVDFTHEARGSVEISGLRTFPANDMKGTLELIGERGTVLSASADIPLRRAATRPKGLPFENFHLVIPGTESPNAVEVREFSFDPITGKMKGLVSTDARPVELLEAVAALLVPAQRDKLVADAQKFVTGTRVLRANSRVFTEIRLDGQGLGAYAAEAPGEAPPFRIESNVRVTVTDLPVGALGGGKRGETSLPARLSLEMNAVADEKTELANVRATLTAQRDDISTTEPLFRLALCRDGEPEKGIDLRPFDVAALNRVLKKLSVPPRRPTAGIRFANYDRLTGTIGRLLSVGSDFLRVLAVENASLTFRMDLADQQLVNDIVGPVLGRAIDDGETTLDVELLFRGADKTNQVRAVLDMHDIRFAELPDPIRVSGEGTFLQSASTIIATELRAGIAIDRGKTPDGLPAKFDLELALSRGGPEGEFGPPAPTRMDFSTGRGHFEVQLESLSREMIEVLLQIQTFNISETLAQPLYDRILGLLGMGPDSKGSSARARMYVVGDLGETHKMHSVIQFADLAPAAFLRLPGDENARVHQRIDVRWEQFFAMDRITNQVAAELFDLRVLDKKGERLGSLSLEGTLPAVFDLATIEAGASKQLETLAASTGPAAGLHQLLAPVLDSLALARNASRTAGAKLVFDVPKIDIAAWSETLERSGVPIRSGTVRMMAQAELNSEALESDMSSLGGEFEALDIEFGRNLSPLPRFGGQIEVAQAGTQFELRKFETTAELDPEYPPVRIALSGTADSVEGTGSTVIAVDGLNAAVLDRLLEVKAAGLGNAAAVIEQIPLGRLREIAGPDADMSLRFNATSREFGRLTDFVLSQSGTRMRIFPDIFAPLSFEIAEEGEVDTSHGITVRRLEGRVVEEGAPEPLLTLAQSGPFTVSHDAADGSSGAEIRLAGTKDLGSLDARVRERLIPLPGRRVDSGIAEFEFVVAIPPGGLDMDIEDASIANKFHAAIRDVKLNDYAHDIDFELNGAVAKKAQIIALEKLTFLASVGGARGGALALDAELDTKTRDYSARLALEDWNHRLIEALAPNQAHLLRGESPRFDAQLSSRGSIDSVQHDMEVHASLRRIPVPPLVLAERTEPWTHAPLLATIDAALAYDGETSVAMAREFAVVIGTEGSTGDARPTETIASLKLSGPAKLPLTEAAAARDAGSANLEFISGPLDLATYAPLLVAATGAPLTKGTISARANVTASGPPTKMIGTVDGNALLENGVWERPDGTTRSLGATVEGHARLIPGGAALEGLLVRLLHPGDPDPEDDLDLSGMYTSEPGKRRAELHIQSDGIAFDRVLDLIATRREPTLPARGDSTPADNPAPAPPRTARIPRDITGLVTLDAKQLIFRKLIFPNATMRATLADGRVELEQFGIEAEKGTATLKASADLGAEVPTYSADAVIGGLAAGPWMDSFAPTLSGRLRGDLDATMRVEGRGLSPEEMARDLRANFVARISEGHFEGTPMKWLFGDLGTIETRMTASLSKDRLVFSADTPRDGTKDIRVSGTLRNAIPREGVLPWVRAVIDLALTDERTNRPKESRDGTQLSPRDRGLGARILIEGPIEPGKKPALLVETIYN